MFRAAAVRHDPPLTLSGGPPESLDLQRLITGATDAVARAANEGKQAACTRTRKASPRMSTRLADRSARRSPITRTTVS